MDIDDYIARFDEEPGYLDFARVGPIGQAAREEESALVDLLARGRFGSFGLFPDQDERLRTAASAVTGFPADHIVFQPNTSQGIFHAMFGIAGNVLMSIGEFPTLPFAASRASRALRVAQPVWLETDHGRITPGNIREQLDSSIVAVAVSLVDFRTGQLVDLEGIRQVIGDRLLIVDAIQGFGVVDVPWAVADVVATGGQKWMRAGWSTGFLALSDRAVERIAPVWSGFNASSFDDGEMPMDEVVDPARGARAFQISNPDPIAQARLAAELEQLERVGVITVQRRVAANATRMIDLADEYALPVVSPRAEHERAGIVAIQPEPDELTVLAAALHNHGVTATIRDGQVRLSAHASTNEETLRMLGAAFLSYSTAI